MQYVQALRQLALARQAATEPKLCERLAAVMQACTGRLMELHPYLVGKHTLDGMLHLAHDVVCKSADAWAVCRSS